ncbi:hypothetical protein ISS85_02790 [Candidatus Microgenomates bacterium]|nr:hypothetical protein [Candidatus Microgenomates bacterium]
MNKKLVYGAIALILILILGFVVVSRSKKEPVQEVKKEKVSSVFSIDELSEDERPVIILSSRPDGKELTLEVNNLQNISVVEYELIYFTEGGRPGLIGTINLKPDEDSFSRKLLLGTCSSGVCRYDEGVTGGTLTVIFRAEKNYKLIKDFTLEKEKNKTVVVME